MLRRLAPLAVIAASSLLGGCIAEERVTYVRAVPDQEAAEIVEISPGPGSVYVSGHWEWNGARYVWSHAHYLRRPATNLVWVEGHWQNTPQGWFWQAGHWAQPHVVRPPRNYRPQRQPAGPPQPPPEAEAPQGEQGEMQSDPNFPPAPTYAPPPPPANIPPPPGGAVPQHYIQQPVPNVGY